MAVEYIDSHFHYLEMLRKNPEAMQIIKSAFSSGLANALDAGVDGEDMETRLGLQREFPGILTAFGYSPHWVTQSDWKARARTGLEEWGNYPDICAIGETGLDYHWNYGKPGEQEELFHMQIDFAENCRKPLIIHSRNADRQTHEILLPHKGRINGVLHCFCSDTAFADKMIDAGLYISFAGNITYKKSEMLRTTAKTTPIDRILLETDSPYLSPEPFRGKDNSPARMGIIHEYVAKIKGISVEKLAEQVRINFTRLFKNK
ncbi:MAG: TatD family deoxyribonuclease [Spirochaetaceae bacterium]|nr:MAG: TatD family deoxyribonuclease [Spirochaetaceae bacterium]